MSAFGLIGDGCIAQRHKKAISKHGILHKIYDPVKYSTPLDDEFFEGLDWVVICSPSHLHYDHVKICLEHDVQIICEKPLALPWQPIIDDDRINIVLQYRWAALPEKIDTIEVSMVRDKAYFESWKGDSLKTGGLFYNLFIHYIDLAIVHNARFIGSVKEHGSNIRKADSINLFSLGMDELYLYMYEDILAGKGIKPKDIFYLMWSLGRQSEIHGFGSTVLNRTIEIERQL